VKKKVVKKGASAPPKVDLSKVFLAPVADLVKAPLNFKEDYDVQLAKLIANLRRNGQVELVQLRELGDGKFEVVNGNHRLDAFNVLGWTQVLAYNLGAVSVEDAQRLALELNETRFRSDHLRIAGIVAALSERYSMEDLESTLPYSRADLDSYLEALGKEAAKVAEEQAAAAAVDVTPKDGLQLVLRLGAADEALWSKIKEAFAGVTDVNEEVFRAVCRSYESRHLPGVKRTTNASKSK